MIISNLLLICHLQALICQSQALHKASLRARCRPVTDADVASCDFATGTSNAPCHVRMVPSGF